MSKKRYPRLFGILPFLGMLLLSGCNWTLLDPKGQVGIEQKNLILIATGLMLLVVIPVIIMTLAFAWKYRASNKAATYTPDWSHSTKIEAAVWIIPILIIIALGYVTYHSTHKLDPYRPLDSDVKPVQIDVVALDWKWLFIYPEQGIATVNKIVFPANTPVNFRVTSDAVMNSFFIPQLGGQIYAMAGMQTHLHLLADEPGVFRGFSANYSGYGFSQMRFKAHSVTEPEFAQWVEAVKAGNGTSINAEAIQKGTLDQAELATLKDGDRSKHQIEILVNRAKAAGDEEALAKAEAMKPFPNKPHPVTYYSSVEPKLFETIINHYMSNYHGADHSAAGHATAETHAAAEHAAQGE